MLIFVNKKTLCQKYTIFLQHKTKQTRELATAPIKKQNNDTRI